MPPVVNIQPRVLPQAVDPRAGEEAIQRATQLLLQQEEQEEQREHEKEVRRLEGEEARETVAARGEQRRKTQAPRLETERDIQGTFGERRLADFNRQLLQGMQQRRGIRARGRQQRRSFGHQFRLEAPLRRRRLGQRDRRMDILERGQMQDFNLGLAELNLQRQLPLMELGPQFLRSQQMPTLGNLRTAISLSRGNVDALTPEGGGLGIGGGAGGGAGRLRGGSTRLDAPPGQSSGSATGAERLQGTPPGETEGAFQLPGIEGGSGLGLIGRQEPSPMEELTPDQRRYLESLPPGERNRILRLLQREQRGGGR